MFIPFRVSLVLLALLAFCLPEPALAESTPRETVRIPLERDSHVLFRSFGL